MKRNFSLFDTLNQKLFDFLNLPQVKQFRNNLIIGSLLLIITKLIVGEYLDLKLRLGLLFLFTGISMVVNLRERIKIPIAISLRKFLGSRFLNDLSWDVPKLEFKYTALNSTTFFSNLKFEFFWSLQYFFQLFYFQVNRFRFFCDNHPYYYIFVYYTLLYYIIFNDYNSVISYITLSLIMTKLIIYFSENNFSEVKARWIEYNPRLKEEELKMSERNWKIFTFWNVRDIEMTTEFKLRYSYIISKSFITNINYKYKVYPFEDEFLLELPLEFKKNIKINNFVEAGNLFYTIINKIIPSTLKRIDNVNAVQQQLNQTVFTNQELSLLKIIPNHDTQFDISQIGGKYWVFISTCTSEKSGGLAPQDAKIVGEHKKFLGVTYFAPVLKKRYSTLAEAEAYIKLFSGKPPKISDPSMTKYIELYSEQYPDFSEVDPSTSYTAEELKILDLIISSRLTDKKDFHSGRILKSISDIYNRLKFRYQTHEPFHKIAADFQKLKIILESERDTIFKQIQDRGGNPQNNPIFIAYNTACQRYIILEKFFIKYNFHGPAILLPNSTPNNKNDSDSDSDAGSDQNSKSEFSKLIEDITKKSNN